MATVFCNNCGSALPDASKFCTSCGTPAPDPAFAPDSHASGQTAYTPHYEHTNQSHIRLENEKTANPDAQPFQDISPPATPTYRENSETRYDTSNLNTHFSEPAVSPYENHQSAPPASPYRSRQTAPPASPYESRQTAPSASPYESDSRFEISDKRPLPTPVADTPKSQHYRQQNSALSQVNQRMPLPSASSADRVKNYGSPLKTWSAFGSLFLMCIPVIGLAFMIIWAISSANASRKSLARGCILLLLSFIIIVAILLALFLFFFFPTFVDTVEIIIAELEQNGILQPGLVIDWGILSAFLR